MLISEVFDLIQLRIEEAGFCTQELVLESIELPQFPEPEDIEVSINGNRICVFYPE